MEKISYYYLKFRQHLPNLSLIESLFCFVVIINSLSYFIEIIYFSSKQAYDIQSIFGNLIFFSTLVPLIFISRYVVVILVSLFLYVTLY